MSRVGYSIEALQLQPSQSWAIQYLQSAQRVAVQVVRLNDELGTRPLLTPREVADLFSGAAHCSRPWHRLLFSQGNSMLRKKAASQQRRVGVGDLISPILSLDPPISLRQNVRSRYDSIDLPSSASPGLLKVPGILVDSSRDGQNDGSCDDNVVGDASQQMGGIAMQLISDADIGPAIIEEDNASDAVREEPLDAEPSSSPIGSLGLDLALEFSQVAEICLLPVARKMTAKVWGKKRGRVDYWSLPGCLFTALRTPRISPVSWRPTGG